MAKRITIRDIAEKSGVSYQTVSRVLNNRSDVADETRERVLGVIETLNYRPSLAARVLNNEQTMIIGLIMPMIPEILSGDSHELQILCGVNQRAALHDYSTLLSTPRTMDDKLSAFHGLLKENLVDGIVVEDRSDGQGAHFLTRKGYPVVTVGYCRSNQLYCVHSDDEGGAYSIAQHLIALGHRQISVIEGPQEDLAMQARWRGLRRALADSGLDTEPFSVVEGNFLSQSGYAAAEQIMSIKGPKPTAIFSFNDQMAIGAIHWLHDHGYDVPEDISVTGFDDIPIAQDFYPSLTTVHQHSYDLGQRAVEVLLDLIDDKKPRTTETVVSCYLVVRHSTAALKR